MGQDVGQDRLKGLVRGRRRGDAERAGPRAWPSPEVAEALGRDHLRSVVVLADPMHEDRVGDWRRRLSSGDVTELSVGVEVADLDEVVSRLSRTRELDLILVVLGPDALAALAKSHRALFRRLFLHLSPRGAYVVDRTVAGERLDHSLTTLTAPPTDREDAAGEAADRRPRWHGGTRFGINDFVRSMSVDDDVVLVVRKRGRLAFKVTEGEVVRLLPDREPGTRVAVFENLPGGSLDPETRYESYGPGPDEAWPRPLPYPDLELRHYDGDLISLGGTRLLAGATVLPESFRYPSASPLAHPRMTSVTRDFVTLDRRAPERTLEGDLYYLDCLFSGHFGHLTTEVVSRLWGWEQARREVPGLRALFHTNPDAGRDGTLERSLFTAYGIRESELVWSPTPVGLRSVVGASPMWHQHEPYYVHPALRDTWGRLTHGLLDGAEPAGYERIFVSRSDRFSSRRGCRNQKEVESVFVEHGFHVFCPEDHSLSDQAAVFAGARVVAGFAGSAMANLMHTSRLEAIVVLGHNAYTGRNEHLFASVLGADLYYFWQQADVAAPRVGRSQASDRSSFAVDLAGQGADLRRVLADL